MPSVGIYISRILLNNVSSPLFAQFYLEIQPIFCMNVQY